MCWTTIVFLIMTIDVGNEFPIIIPKPSIELTESALRVTMEYAKIITKEEKGLFVSTENAKRG